MRLRDIIDALESADDSFCIVAKRPWGPDAQAMLVRLTADYRVPEEMLKQGYEYFLEISVALEEVLFGVGSALSREQRFCAVLYYAEHDAFPEWLCNLRDQRSH